MSGFGVRPAWISDTECDTTLSQYSWVSGTTSSSTPRVSQTCVCALGSACACSGIAAMPGGRQRRSSQKDCSNLRQHSLVLCIFLSHLITGASLLPSPAAHSPGPPPMGKHPRSF